MVDLDLDPRIGLQQNSDSGCFSVEHDTSRCSKECEDILEWYKRLVDQECTLDSRLMGFREGFHRVPDTSVFFCSRSGLAALSRRLFQFILVIFAAMTGHNLLNLVKRMTNGELQTYRHYNFSVIECRNHTLDPELLPHISRFGMLRDGKDRRFASVKKEVQSEMYARNGSMLVSYQQAVDTNGFYFVTAASDPALDPVRFMVFGSNDLVSWKHIGSSSWHFNIFDFSFTLHNGHYDTSTDRSRVHIFDMRTPQPEAFLLVAICVIKTLGLCLAALFGMLNKEIIGKYALVCAFAINTFLNLACAYLDQQNRVMLLMTTLFCAAHMIIWTAERRLIESYGILFGLGAAYGLATGGPSQSVDMEQIFIGLILIIVIYANRYRIISGSRRLVHNDRSRYDKEWKSLLDDAEESKHLSELAGLVSKIELTCPSGTVRHTSVSSMEGGQESYMPVKSLDQLYVQAVCMDHILRAKSQSWASASEGYFPSSETSPSEGKSKSYISWRECASSGNEQTQIKWARLKSVSRAIEKIGRCYGGEVSFLLDICRQAIIFDNTSSLIKCLAAIHSDSDTTILRVKNRLDMFYDASSSAGYRDVLVNLTVRTDETLDLGVAGLVCEVQLRLKRFDELSSDEGHKRYVIWRNMRAQ